MSGTNLLAPISYCEMYITGQPDGVRIHYHISLWQLFVAGTIGFAVLVGIPLFSAPNLSSWQAFRDSRRRLAFLDGRQLGPHGASISEICPSLRERGFEREASVVTCWPRLSLFRAAESRGSSVLYGGHLDPLLDAGVAASWQVRRLTITNTGWRRPPRATSSGYDAVGNITVAVSPDLEALNYEYDADNRLQRLRREREPDRGDWAQVPLRLDSSLV